MLEGPVRGQNIGCIRKNTKLTNVYPQKDLLSLAHTPNCYKIPKVITIAMSWCSLNICPVNYASIAVFLYDIKITDNLNVQFSAFFTYKVDSLLFIGRSIHLRLVCG